MKQPLNWPSTRNALDKQKESPLELLELLYILKPFLLIDSKITVISLGVPVVSEHCHHLLQTFVKGELIRWCTHLSCSILYMKRLQCFVEQKILKVFFKPLEHESCKMPAINFDHFSYVTRSPEQQSMQTLQLSCSRLNVDKSLTQTC